METGRRRRGREAEGEVNKPEKKTERKNAREKARKLVL